MPSTVLDIEAKIFCPEDAIEERLCEVLSLALQLNRGKLKKKQTDAAAQDRYFFSYRINSKGLFFWQKKKSGRLLAQSVYSPKSGDFSVIFYRDKNSVQKINYYYADHTWKRTEYYSPNPLAEDQLLAQLYPIDGGNRIELEITDYAEKSLSLSLERLSVLTPYPAEEETLSPALSEGIRRGTLCPFLPVKTTEGMRYYCRKEDIPAISECIRSLTQEQKGIFPRFFSESSSEAAESPTEAAAKIPEVSFEEALSEPILTPTEQPEVDAAFAPAQAEEKSTEEAPAMQEAPFGEAPADDFSILRDKDGHFLYGGGLLAEKRQGIGLCYDQASGYSFLGSWHKDEVADGFGCAFDRNGQLRYCGDWLNGFHHGEGISYRANGQMQYSGSWVEGKYHGAGKYTCTGGTAFSAQFDRGIPRGEALLYTPEGAVQKGYFNENSLDATVLMTEQLCLYFHPYSSEAQTKTQAPPISEEESAEEAAPMPTFSEKLSENSSFSADTDINNGAEEPLASLLRKRNKPSVDAILYRSHLLVDRAKKTAKG